MTKNEAYNEICNVIEEVRKIRKRYTTFAPEDKLNGMVAKLIKCEEELESEARKHCK